LSLRDGALPSTAALAESVATVASAPAVFPERQRAVQIATSALLPILSTAGTVGNLLFAGQRKGLGAVEPTSIWAAALGVASAALLVAVPFALFGAFVARGGFTLRAFGAAVVNRRGEPASRFRVLWRAMVTWSPAAVLPVLFLVVRSNPTATGLDARGLILPSAGLALIVAGAVWTALHPSRSIQDRLAGTWIVPR
jgi:hypothetical protein